MDKINRFYYLHCESTADIRLDILVNGFPVHLGMLDKNYSMPFLIAPYLFSGVNTLTVKLSESDENSMLENANVSALVTFDIRAFDEGDYVTPDSGKYISLSELDKPREKEYTHETYTHNFSPVTEKELSLEFIQQDFHATDLLSLKPLTESKQELIDFAKSIRDMFVNKDISGFMTVYQPKANALAYTHFKNRDEVNALVKMQMQEGMSKELLTIDEESIDIQYFMEQKLARIVHGNGMPIILTEEDDDGAVELDVFVASVDGKLAIIR